LNNTQLGEFSINRGKRFLKYFHRTAQLIIRYFKLKRQVRHPNTWEVIRRTIDTGIFDPGKEGCVHLQQRYAGYGGEEEDVVLSRECTDRTEPEAETGDCQGKFPGQIDHRGRVCDGKYRQTDMRFVIHQPLYWLYPFTVNELTEFQHLLLCRRVQVQFYCNTF